MQCPNFDQLNPHIVTWAAVNDQSLPHGKTLQWTNAVVGGAVDEVERNEKQMPTVGLEPTTTRLRVLRSTN